MKKSAIIILVLIGFLLPGLIHGAIPSYERAALIALYNSTNGDSWRYNTGWKDGTLEADGFGPIGSEGTWYGTVASDHVTQIYLWSNQLTGSIPAELGNLTNLQGLYLYDNQLTGSIPAELGNLTNLYALILEYNQLTGSIPAELGNLTNLTHLYLYENGLTGSIPPEYGNLSNLISLRLYSNQLTGSIPAELGNMTNLEYLRLYSNQLTGSIPAELGNLTNLIFLYLHSNQLSGEIPTSLTNLINMYYLDIGYNCLYTNDSALRAWLDTHDPDWEDYQCDTESPFGSFDTPLDGSTVRSSIPVTGWALDNWGIDTVKIYRAQGNTLLYIGDAMLVEGARPDVAAQYPGYPNNTKAGWGYMMLTNFLPNGGNGTFVIHAIATDISGKTTILGSKTIHCDNSNAVKPFGAIDTPGQGGTASGSNFVNWGWVLTPQLNSIPTDGSTINVFVDSVNLGHPTYNNYRADIATLFPGYANSNGAVGYFYLDTTAYNNGVHTIFWIATDSGGNADGIGSRYFTIQNTGSSRSANKIAGNNHWKPIIKIEELSNLPFNYFEPIKIKKGYGKNIQSKIIQLDEENIFRIEIKELERIEVQLSNVKAGYMLAGNRIYPLPLGSTLDTKNGTFNWIPGPGFYGNYMLVFVTKEQNGELSKQEIIVSIIPKFGIRR